MTWRSLWVFSFMPSGVSALLLNRLGRRRRHRCYIIMCPVDSPTTGGYSTTTTQNIIILLHHRVIFYLSGKTLKYRIAAANHIIIHISKIHFWIGFRVINRGVYGPRRLQYFFNLKLTSTYPIWVQNIVRIYNHDVTNASKNKILKITIVVH